MLTSWFLFGELGLKLYFWRPTTQPWASVKRITDSWWKHQEIQPEYPRRLFFVSARKKVPKKELQTAKVDVLVGIQCTSTMTDTRSREVRTGTLTNLKVWQASPRHGGRSQPAKISCRITSCSCFGLIVFVYDWFFDSPSVTIMKQNSISINDSNNDNNIMTVITIIIMMTIVCGGDDVV